MFTVAYFANQFPAAVEPYVAEEIEELRRRGVHVVAGTARKSSMEPDADADTSEIVSLQPIRIVTLFQALWLLFRHGHRIAGLLRRILLRGKESPARRFKALLHTWLGAYYATLLKSRGIDHIHAHHGYFGSWIAMVASRLLGAGFSMTLHGSDVLLAASYLETKLENCKFCMTISEYNRRHILDRFPSIEAEKIIVSRLGVDTRECTTPLPPSSGYQRRRFTLLAVGRLHPVKNHAFLVRACARLHDRGLEFECLVAGEGPERHRLELLIATNDLQNRCTLLGHIAREQMSSLYRRADVVVLTSRSEGIPLALMEAMARGKVVLAPAITGIPELVIAGKTGFLYAPGALEDFISRLLFLHSLIENETGTAISRLDWIRHAARIQVLQNFSRTTNLSRFTDRFLERITAADAVTENWNRPHEDLVLQQI
jgi:colanic acid/amylovoran biosynthesis glycosyltransferase